MAKADHRVIRPRRIEVAQFIVLLCLINYPDVEPLQAFEGTAECWMNRKISFDKSRLRLFESLHRRMKRGSSLGSKVLGNPLHRINLELPLESVRFTASFIDLSGRSNEGDRRLEKLLIRRAPDAWLFAWACANVISARPGRPKSGYSRMLTRLPDAAISERHCRRLKARLKSIDDRPSLLVTGLLAAANLPNKGPPV